MSSMDSISDGPEAEDEFESDSDYEYDNSSDDDVPDELRCNEQPASLFNQEPIACPICCDERVEEGYALTLPSCSHSFCAACFTQYVETQIGQGNADNIVCPFIQDGVDGYGKIGKQCNASVAMDVLHEIMSQDSYDRLKQQSDAAFVRKNVDYHHCPTPDCSNIVLCKRVVGNDDEGGGARICDCFKCGHASCLSCGASPFHTNQTCAEYKKEKETWPTVWSTRLLPLDLRSRANEAANYVFSVERQPVSSSNDHIIAENVNDNEDALLDSTKQCHRRGNRVELQDGFLKMKCVCGYRFYAFSVEQQPGSSSNDHTIAENENDNEDALLASIKRCRRCGNGIELQDGCLKMKCLCGYRFCYQCGSENAQCSCTPAHHGFVDNRTGGGDFSGLREAKSYT